MSISGPPDVRGAARPRQREDRRRRCRPAQAGLPRHRYLLSCGCICRVRSAPGRLRQRREERHIRMVGPEKVVVAGAGLAGLRTVEELRARGYGGQITLVGAETRPPYDRPPLSKKLMTGELDDTSLRADLDSLGARVLLGHTATQLRPGVLTTDAGEHDFDALVLATGATPVRLPGPGPQHVLRTMDEALALRALLRPGTTLCVVGAGWIGAELATAAMKRGSRVTVLE